MAKYCLQKSVTVLSMSSEDLRLHQPHRYVYVQVLNVTSTSQFSHHLENASIIYLSSSNEHITINTLVKKNSCLGN